MLRICLASVVTFAFSTVLSAQPPLPKFPPLPGKPPFLSDPTASESDSSDQSSNSPPAVIREFLDQVGENAPSPEEFLKAIEQSLGSDDVKQRLQALLAIDSQRKADESILPKLDEILKNAKNPFEQMLAAGASLRSGSGAKGAGAKGAIESLAKGLRSEDPAVAIQAALGLGRGGQQSEQALLGALEDSNPRTRSLAAEALGQVTSDSAGKKLAALLQDDNVNVRAAAAKSLGSAGEQFAEALLNTLNNDSQLSVRANAAASLARISSGNADVQSALAGAMLGEKENEAMAVIRAIANSDAPLNSRANLLGAALTKAQPAHAAEIIGHLVDMEDPGMQALIPALESETSRYWAAVALSEFGSKAAGAGGKLASLLDSSTPDVKTEILFTLGNIDPDLNAVAPAVSKAMSAKENGVRYAATLTAIRLGMNNQAVQTQLAANRTSNDKVLALVSAFALAKLNPGEPKLGLEALNALRQAVASNDPRLKPLAEQALKDLKASLPQLPDLPPLPKLPSFPR